MRPLFALLLLAAPAVAAEPIGWRIATFDVEVTPPLGHPCMGGGIPPAKKIDDPLYARGFALLGPEKPVVYVAVDWCEIRNDAYDRWRDAIAEAVGTVRERVMVSALHQHDAPIADLAAQRMLNENKSQGAICDLEFHEKTVLRVAKAAKASLAGSRPLTHIGTAEAKVDKVASNRRYFDRDGVVRYNRMSRTRDEAIRNAEEGTIDPFLKTLSFWDGDTAVAAISAYATHPMSYYGKGGVSADFVGMARRKRQADDGGILGIYVTGCSGNVTCGKYNDGAEPNRAVLADRLYVGMKAAWKATKKTPLTAVQFRCEQLSLDVRDGGAFTEAALAKRLREDPKPFGQCLAALGLSWRQRVEAKRPIDVPVLDFGTAALMVLPAEAYVEFQLFAQKCRPDAFVVVAGYGESGPGYIPTERAWKENDVNLHDWCWVPPGSEQRMNDVIEKALKPKK